LESLRGGAQLQWGVKIPLRDGTRLSASLYLPKGKTEPAPCLLAITPYTVQRNHLRASYFAARGYPFVVVDARGRGNSEGEFRPYSQEPRDGYDIVEWIARQPFCNGQVAMFSGSYEGYAQWATAAEHPPHLATIAPGMAPALGRDWPMRNNIAVCSYFMQWLTYVTGRTFQENIVNDQEYWRDRFREWFESGRPFKELDGIVGNPSPIFQEWVAHPSLDEYWSGFEPSAEQFAKIELPILTLTGCYDGTQPGALHYYRQHLRHASVAAAAQHYLVIGPWDHASVFAPKREFAGLQFGPDSVIDMLQLNLEWYRWTLQGGPKPAFLRKKVAYYVMGAEKWRYADTLDGVTSHTVPYYLHSTRNPTDIFSSGSMTENVPAHGGPDSYFYDPRDVSLAQLESTVDPENRTDHRMIHAAPGKQLIYHSAPFERDREISGFFKLQVWLAIDQPDTDFRASVYEIGLDGRAIQLTTDWLRARYRESLREERLIGTTEPLRYDFERFMFVSRQVKAGHRLRLVVGPINSIYVQKNYNSGGVVSDESMRDARPVTVRLFHDEAHPSALHVPLGQPETDD
jgi:uncharacterized protein